MKTMRIFLLFTFIVCAGLIQAQNLITGNSDIGSPTTIQSYGSPTPTAIVRNGNYLYIGFWGGNTRIDVWNVSDPSSPSLAGSFNLGTTTSSTYNMFVVDNTLYICTRYDLKLWEVDISNPTNITVTGSVAMPDFPAALFVEGNYAYVASDNARALLVVDLTTSSIVATRSLSSYGSAIVKAGNYVYVGVANGHLIPFDVTDPTNPVQGTILATSSGPSDIKQIGDYIYLSEDAGVLQTVSISTPATPVIVNSVTISTGKGINNLNYDGTYLYAGTSALGDVGAITVFDISTSDAPVQLAQSVAQNIRAEVAVVEGYAFAISTYQNTGLYSYRLSTANNAIKFDGLNDYVTVPNSASLNPTQITVECWAKSNNSTWNDMGFLVSKRFSYVLHPNERFMQFKLYQSGTERSVGSSTNQSYDITQWHHYAGTYDGTTLKLYVDGVLIESAPYTGTIDASTGAMNIGFDDPWGNNSGSRYMAGSVDEVRIWNYARSQCEIQQAMNTELIGNEAGLAAYYNFNQGIANCNNTRVTTLYDKTSNRNNGTLKNLALSGTTSNWIESDVNVSGKGNFEDTFAPVPDNETLADINAPCEVTSLNAPTATDICSGTITGTTNVTLPITAQGTTVVTWTYDDGNGNVSTQTQNVVIDDITAPVLNKETLDDVTAECEVTELTAPTATDNCAGSITGTYDITLPVTAQGTTVVTWTFDDGNGNKSTQTQNIVIDDVTAPALDSETLNDITAECEITELTAPTATDNCAGSITGTYDITLPVTAQGTTVVTWTFDDGNGNKSTQTQNIVVDDVTAPVLDSETLNDITAECEVTALTAPSATDNCAGSITGTYDVTLPVLTQGTTLVTWTYDDGNGNITTQTQNIVITDETNPTISCVENQTKNLGVGETSYSVSGAEFDPASSDDNCTVASVINNFNNAASLDGAQFPTGTTTVIWTVADGSGKTSACSFDVTVNANTSGFEELSKANIHIYPNPTDGLVKLVSTENKITELKVMNLAGKEVLTKTNIQPEETIDLSNLDNGIYLFVITSNGEVYSTKVIKK